MNIVKNEYFFAKIGFDIAENEPPRVCVECGIDTPAPGGSTGPISAAEAMLPKPEFAPVRQIISRSPSGCRAALVVYGPFRGEPHGRMQVQISRACRLQGSLG